MWNKDTVLLKMSVNVMKKVLVNFWHDITPFFPLLTVRFNSFFKLTMAVINTVNAAHRN